MIREIAGYDVARYAEVGAWPLAEALLAYEARMIERAERRYWREALSWQIGGGKEQPKLPAALREE